MKIFGGGKFKSKKIFEVLEKENLKVKKFLEAELCRSYSFLKIKKIFSQNTTPRISFLVRCVDEQILFGPKATIRVGIKPLI